MKFSESLKKNSDFQKVYRQGKSYANRYLVMYVLENHTEGNRLGISVSKKVGNSVIRHHLTRLIRESYRLHEDIELIDRLGIIPERIDIGGGLFGKMPDELKKQFTSDIPQYKDYAKVAATVFAEYFKDKDVKPELVIEPGSAVVGDCMRFVGTVKTIKNVRGQYIASVLGSQKNISMSGVNPPIEVIHMGNETTEYGKLNMVGFTCIEGDVLYKDYTGELAIGDAVVISNCGSYSLVMKPPFILPNFPVLDICGKNVEVIKRAETFDDIFHTFNF